MYRQTVTALARAMGGKLLFSEDSHAHYQFNSSEATLEFREKIPFHSVWGGQGDNPNIPPLTVFFDILRDITVPEEFLKSAGAVLGEDFFNYLKKCTEDYIHFLDIKEATKNDKS